MAHAEAQGLRAKRKMPGYVILKNQNEIEALLKVYFFKCFAKKTPQPQYYVHHCAFEKQTIITYTKKDTQISSILPVDYFEHHKLIKVETAKF